MKVIIINGYPGAGKDTFCDLCKKHYERTFQIHASDYVKAVFTAMGWEGEKTSEIRKAMADFMAMSEKIFDHPYKYIFGEVTQIVEWFPDALIFIHSREPHNIKRYTEAFDALTLLIAKEDIPEGINNASDSEVNNYPYDRIILNTGTLKELEVEAEKFVKEVMG